jgi:hypothetical protein
MFNPDQPEMHIQIETDPRAVKEVADHLTRSFNGYLRGHRGTQMPDALLGLCHFWLSVASDQADRMELSPEQRDSYYRTALSVLVKLVTADMEQILAMRFVAQANKKGAKG